MTQPPEQAPNQATNDHRESTANATPAADPAPPKDPGADLTIRLAQAEADATTAKDEWLRAKAETDNIRRRSAEEVLKAQKYGVEKIADALLAVKDSLDAALKVDSPSVDAYKQGVELTARQLTLLFERFSIQEVDPVGQKFDPTRHQAITTLESDQEPNTVVAVMQKGYTLHERVLRPALVAVARAKDDSG